MPLKHLLLVIAVFLCVLIEVPFSSIEMVGADPAVPGYGKGKPLTPAQDCAGLCGTRCSQHSRPNLCLRACSTCCYRCKCVPPGTSGNREMCGTCYTDMTTHGNKTKCP